MTAATQDGEVTVTADGVPLPGRLTVSSGAVGVVVFAHGSGSSRNSARNRHVADVLHRSGLGTLLFDLLTDAEAARRENVFDIGLLARRLTGAVAWVRNRPAAVRLPVGLFGASTGAAATLVAAADAGSGIGAVVSRGGRPDLAGARLADVRSPTLLIVGGSDDVVLDLNRAAQKELSCTNRLVVVPGAGHLFEEPGTLDAVADLAAEWFSSHLPASG
ncbi:MAG TPA: dienelactone hydrolase family protein [Actinoplanes sp.]